jgi:2'-phosphotransferase
MRQQNGGGWQAVKEDGKQRFGLLVEGGQLLIRANQGHTINTVESEVLLKAITSAKEIPGK